MPYVDNDIPLATKRKWEHDPTSEPYHKPFPRSTLSPREAPEPVDSSLSPTPTRKTLHPTKRFRPSHQDADNDVHSSHRRREPSTTHNADKFNSSTAVLLPCHVCHRRPMKKSDLDSFARCQACREQTCFICMRECQGGGKPRIDMKPAIRTNDEEAPSRSFHMRDVDAAPLISHTDEDIIDVDIGDDDDERTGERYTHHSMICSRCCVEQGVEGEVICLGCLSDPYTSAS